MRFLSPALLALGLLSAPLAWAQPQTPPSVNITPKRMTLDKTHRIGQILVYNQGSQAGEFNINLVDFVMVTDGSIVPRETAAAKPETRASAERLASGKGYMVVSPRRVTLQPHAGQYVRVRLNELPDGVAEVRSHLLISTLPPPSEGNTADAAAARPSNALSVNINSVYGVSIPVIGRGAAAEPHATVGNVRLEEVQQRNRPGGPIEPTSVAAFDLARTGANSLFGDIEVRSGGQLVGSALSVGVYAEIDKRAMRVPLTKHLPPGSKLQIRFIDQDANPGTVLVNAGS